MPIELTCLIMLVANAVLLMLIIMLVKKFNIKKLRNYIRQLEAEKLDDNEEILKLQYELFYLSGKQEVSNRSKSQLKFSVINMN